MSWTQVAILVRWAGRIPGFPVSSLDCSRKKRKNAWGRFTGTNIVLLDEFSYWEWSWFNEIVIKKWKIVYNSKLII